MSELGGSTPLVQRSTFAQDTAPEPDESIIWIDTSQNPNNPKVYDDDTKAWIPVNTRGTVVSQTKPTVESGKVWFKPVSNGVKLYVANNDEWSFLKHLNYIPDSVITRPDNNGSSFNVNAAYGPRLEAEQEWKSIGGQIDSNTALTTAKVYRVSDGELLGSTDISSLGPGDTFTVDLSPSIKVYDGTLETTYNFVCEGSSNYEWFYYNSPSYPYVSSDGDLRIVTGARNAQDTISGNLGSLKRVGDVGF